MIVAKHNLNKRFISLNNEKNTGRRKNSTGRGAFRVEKRSFRQVILNLLCYKSRLEAKIF
jgi:hypothetical protein